MHTINYSTCKIMKISMHYANAVRGRSYEKNFYTKIYHTKVSLHENFQIYGMLKIILA